jgi:hypothetical protein
MRLNILKYSLVFCVALLAFMHGNAIEMSKQMPLFEGLRNTSAIIFGVMGAWLAILHPDSLKKVFGEKGARTPEKEKATIMLLFSPILISTTIIAFVLVLFPLVELAKTIDSLLQYKELLRKLAFAMLSILTLLQLWALILTLVPGDIVKKHIDIENAQNAVSKRMFSGARKRNGSN